MPNKNLEIFKEEFYKGMKNPDKNFEKFKRDYRTLLKCILSAMDRVSKDKENQNAK